MLRVNSVMLMSWLAVAGWAGTAGAAVVYDCNGNGSPDAATSCTLETLVRNGGSITVGDKRFSGWSFFGGANFNVELIVSGDGFALAANAAHVSVTGLDDGGDYGLRFAVPDVSTTWNAFVGGTGTALQRSRFIYTVEVLDPSYMIVGNTLEVTDFDLNINGGADRRGLATVFEHEGLDAEPDFSDAKLVGQIFDSNFNPNQLLDETLDTLSFAPTSSRQITTTISVFGSSEDGATVIASVEAFEERFAQVRVPEPASLGLVALGLGGLALMRRRKQR